MENENNFGQKPQDQKPSEQPVQQVNVQGSQPESPQEDPSEGNNSTNTVLIVVVIIIIFALGIIFFAGRGGDGTDTPVDDVPDTVDEIGDEVNIPEGDEATDGGDDGMTEDGGSDTQ